MERSSPDSSAEAETLLLDALENRPDFASEDLAELCRTRPDLAPALESLYGRLRQGRELVGALSPAAGSFGDDRAPAHSAAPELAEGLEPRYRVVREVARGGMSIILEVWDSRLRRHMAMKRLRPVEPGVHHGSIERERRRARLFHEAQVLAQLAHPGIVPMHDVARDQHGDPYFTMLLVHGEDLSAIFRRTWEARDGWNLGRAVGVLQRVCESVAYAHEKGVIHRDLKPANVMVGAFGETYVMDWGLARAEGDGAPVDLPVEGVSGPSEDASAPAARPSTAHSLVRTDRAEMRHASGTSPLLTQEGDVVGTPAYMSPEQAEGRLDGIAASSDVYSAGAMLYELLARHPPYCDEDSNRSPHDVLHEVRREAPEPLRKVARTAPDELIAICERAMAREPARRYASMRALADDLRAFLENRVVRAHRTGALVELRKWVQRNRWAAIAGGILVAALAGIALVQTVLKREVDLARKTTEARAEELRRENYVNKIALAAAARTSEDIALAKELLAACPVDLRGWEWRHLSREVDTSDRFVPALEGGFDGAAWSPDGRWIATGHHDVRPNGWLNRVLLRDAASLQVLHALPIDNLSEGPAFSPDGTLLGATTRGGRVYVWEVESGLERFSPEGREFQSGVAFSPDGAWIAAGSTRGRVHIWRASTGSLVRILEGHGDQVATVAFSPDGKRLYSTSWDRTVRVWDLETGAPIRVIAEHSERVFSVAASPDGRYFASGGWDGAPRVFDASTFALAYRFPRGKGGGTFWSPDSRRLALTNGPALHLYDTATFDERVVLAGHDAAITGVAFSHDSSWIATTSSDGLRLWDLERGEREQERRLGREHLFGLAFSPDGRELACKADSSELEIWDARSQRKLRDVAGIEGRVLIRWSPTGEFVAVSSTSGGVELLDTESWQFACRFGEGHANDFNFSPDGERLSIADNRGFLSLWDARTGERMWSVRAYEGVISWPHGVFGGAFSPDGGTIATGARDGCVKLWRSATGELARVIRGAAETYLESSFSPDGKMLVASSGALEAFDLESGETMWITQTLGVRWPRFSPDGQRLFTGNTDGELGVWDPSNGRRLLTLPGHRNSVVSLAVSPDGERVATGASGTLRIYDTRPWR